MIDQEKIKQAVRLLLEGIGEDPSREGLVETPERIARMYEEIYGGLTEMCIRDRISRMGKLYILPGQIFSAEDPRTRIMQLIQQILHFFRVCDCLQCCRL